VSSASARLGSAHTDGWLCEKLTGAALCLSAAYDAGAIGSKCDWLGSWLAIAGPILRPFSFDVFVR
jgi:hypothetical protein